MSADILHISKSLGTAGGFLACDPFNKEANIYSFFAPWTLAVVLYHRRHYWPNAFRPQEWLKTFTPLHFVAPSTVFLLPSVAAAALMFHSSGFVRKHWAKMLLCRVSGSASRSARCHKKNPSGCVSQGQIRATSRLPTLLNSLCRLNLWSHDTSVVKFPVEPPPTPDVWHCGKKKKRPKSAKVICSRRWNGHFFSTLTRQLYFISQPFDKCLFCFFPTTFTLFFLMVEYVRKASRYFWPLLPRRQSRRLSASVCR